MTQQIVIEKSECLAHGLGTALDYLLEPHKANGPTGLIAGDARRKSASMLTHIVQVSLSCFSKTMVPISLLTLRWIPSQTEEAHFLFHLNPSQGNSKRFTYDLREAHLEDVYNVRSNDSGLESHPQNCSSDPLGFLFD